VTCAEQIWLRRPVANPQPGAVNGHLLALYLAAVFVAMIAPGPDMIFVLASGVRGGPRVGFLPCAARRSAAAEPTCAAR
jgi:hypothetical protein